MLNLKLPNWFERLLSILERIILKLTEPSRHSLSLSIVTDLPRSKSQLIAENALLRQQLFAQRNERSGVIVVMIRQDLSSPA